MTGELLSGKDAEFEEVGTRMIFYRCPCYQGLTSIAVLAFAVGGLQQGASSAAKRQGCPRAENRGVQNQAAAAAVQKLQGS